MNKTIIFVLLMIIGLIIGYLAGSAARERSEEAAGNSATSTTVIDEGNQVQANVLADTVWQWQSRTDEGDMVTTPNNPESFVLTFGDNGRVNTTTDCNNAMGSVTFEGQNISFGPLATTRRACPEPNDEQSYLQALRQVDRFELFDDNEVLVLYGNDFELTFQAFDENLTAQERYCLDLKRRVDGSKNFVIMTGLSDGSVIASGDEISGCVYAPNMSYGGWAPFEGQIGSYQVLDSEQGILGEGSLPVVDDLWMERAMNNGSLQYQGELVFDQGTATSGEVVLRNENASGDVSQDREVRINVVFQ